MKLILVHVALVIKILIFLKYCVIIVGMFLPGSIILYCRNRNYALARNTDSPLTVEVR